MKLMETLMLAAISGSSMVNLLVTVIVVGLICWLLWWLISYIGLPAPFDKVARVLIALVAVLFLINAILQVSGQGGFIKW